ncbi:MAG: glycosyltransferase family 4 protein [Candidatus Omnitrophota bacterium]
MRDESLPRPPEHDNLRIRNTLNWFNPFGWIYEAFRIKTKIIHAQWWSFPLAPIYIIVLGISKIRHKKIVLTIHNVLPHEKNFLKILLNKSVFYLGDEYIVHTKKNCQDLRKIIKDKTIHVVPHGLIFPPLQDISKEKARDILHIPRSDKILLCFGHIRDYKGLDVAIKALSLIKDPQVKLLVAGKCWEDWQKYDNLITQYNLSDRVYLKLDFISMPDIEPIFKASDLVLLPYKHFDAQSGVGAIGIPFEIPLIVSRTGGLQDYATDENCRINAGDFEDLAKKIEKILSDTELYRKIKADVCSVKKQLRWDEIARKTVEIYENITRTHCPIND